MSENVKKNPKIGHSDKEKERNNVIVNCVKKNQQHDLTWNHPTQGWATNTTNEWTQLREELEEEPLLVCDTSKSHAVLFNAAGRGA